MDNFKKRMQREKDEQSRYAEESVLADLLPTLDNLDLALQYGSKVEACKDTADGRGNDPQAASGCPERPWT